MLGTSVLGTSVLDTLVLVTSVLGTSVLGASLSGTLDFAGAPELWVRVHVKGGETRMGCVRACMEECSSDSLR